MTVRKKNFSSSMARRLAILVASMVTVAAVSLIVGAVAGKASAHQDVLLDAPKPRDAGKPVGATTTGRRRMINWRELTVWSASHVLRSAAFYQSNASAGQGLPSLVQTLGGGSYDLGTNRGAECSMSDIRTVLWASVNPRSGGLPC